MISRLLLLSGLAVVDLDLTARALASRLLRTHGQDIDTLSEWGTKQELMRMYAVIATETGMPIGAQRKVADMAWQYITQAGGVTERDTGELALYW